MVEIKDIFELKRDNINPMKYPNKKFRHYSIPSFITEKGYEVEIGSNIKSNKFKVYPNSILISRINPRIPRIIAVREANEDTICSTEFVVLKFKDKNFEEFIDYFVALFYSNAFYEYLKLHVTGTSGSHQRVNPLDVMDFEFELHDKKDILNLSKIYGEIQNKIRLNQKIIKLIDEIGESLFTLYFLCNKKISSPQALGDFIEVLRGCSYRSDDLNGEDGLVTINCFNVGGGFKIEGVKPFSGKYRESHVINEGDIIISKTDITQRGDLLGRALLIPNHLDYKRLICSLDTGIVRMKNKFLSSYFLYFLFNSKEFQKYILGYANGTTVLHLDSNGITDYILDTPQKEVLDKFDDYVTPLMNVYKKNVVENQRLHVIKDEIINSFFK